MDERTKKLIDTYKTQGPLTTSQIGDVITTTSANEPITSANLSSSETPLIIPQASQSSAAPSLSAISTGVVGQTRQQSQLEKETADREAQALSKSKESESGLRALMSRITGIGQERGALEEKAGIAGKTQKVTDVTNQIEALDRAEVNELRALESQNMTSAGNAAAQAGIRRKYAFEKADLALIQSAANRDLLTAQSIIDNKIKLQLEPLQQQLEFEKLFYQENRNALSKAEDRAFNAKISADERQYNEAKTLQEQIGSLLMSAVSQEAPSSVIQGITKARTLQEAIQASGQYAGDVLERQKKVLEIQKLNTEIKNLGIGNITNPEASKYAGALGVILGSDKFTKEQRAAVINAVNTGQDPVSVIKNQAKNVMGQTLATDLSKYETAKAQLDSISSLLSQFYTNGGDTGIFTGNYEKAINKLGTVSDPKLVSIATNIAAALQIYRNAVSGTAYSVQEGKDIASIFPGINKSQGLNEAIISGRKQAFDVTIDQGYKNVLGNTYDELKKAQQLQNTDNDPLGIGIDPNNNPLGI